MKRTAYHKLVRDRIPEVIEASGKQALFHTADHDAMMEYLHEKLKEEAAEYLQSNSLEELADLLEVIHGITKCMGKAWEEVEAVRLAKRQERGGFENGIVLTEVIEP